MEKAQVPLLQAEGCPGYLPEDQNLRDGRRLAKPYLRARTRRA